MPGGGGCEFALLDGEGGVVVVDANERLVRVDAQGAVVWELDLPVHHELVRLEEGGWLAPFWHVREYRGRRVRFDGLVWVSEEGRATRGWWSHDHLEQLQALHPPLVLDTVEPPSADAPDAQTYDYYHLNSVQVLPPTELGERDARFAAGNLLLHLRNANLLLVLEPRELAIVWHARPEGLDFAHTPRVLDDGGLLVFDNGAHRDWSRAWELSLPELETLWEYRGTERDPFWTEFRGSAQRLANGNTLLCEADRGRAFEVTRAGEIVWEYWNPPQDDGSRRRIYRMLRLEE